MPHEDGSNWPLLERIIFPEAIVATRPGRTSHDPVRLRLVRDASIPLRPASALRCSPENLAAWAHSATSAELAALKGAWVKPGAPLGQAAVLLTGAIGTLPPLAGAMRFWGTELLIPLGFRAEPDLPASAIRAAAGAGSEHLAVLDEAGIELIPLAVFKPISRAAVRMIALRSSAKTSTNTSTTMSTPKPANRSKGSAG